MEYKVFLAKKMPTLVSSNRAVAKVVLKAFFLITCP